MTRNAKAAPGNVKETKRTNSSTLRAIIIKSLGEEETKQISEEPVFTDVSGLVAPPYPILHLSTLRENSTELGQCVDAMVTNVSGFGYRLREVKMTEEEKKFKQNAIDAENANLSMFLDNINFEQDVTSLREDTHQDTEETGNGYWEMIPYANKSGISSIERMPPHTVRLTGLDKTSTKINMKYFNKVTKKVESRPIKKKFRRFVHNVGTKVRYFKEWGDPRAISNEDGKVAQSKDQALEWKKKGVLANPVLHFKYGTNRSPYGLPKFIGNLFSIYGSRGAEEINYVTFENNNIPSMIFMVSNGQLTGESIKRLQDFIDLKIKGSSNRSSFLVLEAEPAEEGQLNPGTIKMDVKDLSNAQKDDQLFQAYDKNNSDKVRRCFRLPPIFVGKSDDYNRATAQESRKIADEQIFSPLRRRFDKTMNKVLVTEFDMKYHTFVSNSANVTNDQDLTKILSSSEKTGGITPNLARMILSDVLNTELPQYNPDKIDFDPDVPLSLTMVERAKNVAGNDQTGVVAPEQGQISQKNKMETVENLLIKSIYKELGIEAD